MQHNRTITLSVAGSRKATNWTPLSTTWQEFIERIGKPQRTSESLEEYLSWNRSKQDEIKDVGGYVGGSLLNGRRKKEYAKGRDIITLDADTIETGGTQRVLNLVASLGCAYAIYSTRKHQPTEPRLRIVLPLDRTATPEEYEAIARKVASLIDMVIFDPTTFEVVRLMYWPSCSRDSEYVFLYEDKPFLSVDGVLSIYDNWQDITQWPVVPGATKIRERSAKKQGDPLQKSGIVGAFCKSYGIERAMEEFLPNVYESAGDGRFTFIGGSTVGGVVVYDDKFVYSHHATDPCSGVLCNAFDMVRHHLFLEDDVDTLPDTPTNRLPSYAKMCEYVAERNEIKQIIVAERVERVQEAFGGSEVQNLDWVNQLLTKPNSGIPTSVPFNMKLILEHDPNLKGLFYYDEFASRIYVTGRLPWDTTFRVVRVWEDRDDAGLRNYFSDAYGINGKEKIGDSLTEVISRTSVHPIKNYLGSLVWDGVPRVDMLLTKYLGAVDSIYTRAVIRKTLVAAVARIYEPGCKFDEIVVLTGPQGAGKSTFWKVLGLNWHSDSLTTFDGKEAAELLQGYWIIELGELTGMNRTEVNVVKSFTARREDVYRAPYGRRTISHPRSCILVGTSNDRTFLRDNTGNRRFWPVDVDKALATKSVWNQLAEEVNQIWAEAVTLYHQKEKIYMDDDLREHAELAQLEHSESDPREGVILNFLDTLISEDWNKKSEDARRIFYMNQETNKHLCTVKRDRICAVELWVECFKQEKGRMRNSDARELNSLLRKLEEWEEMRTPRKTICYGSQRVFIRKAYDNYSNL